MAVRTFLLPTELFVHKADKVLHISSRLPDSEEHESVSACFDVGLCQQLTACSGSEWAEGLERILAARDQHALEFARNNR